jgi:transcription antitermination factor NusG
MLVAERSRRELPVDLFADQSDALWYLLRTRTRQEKVVARELATRHVLHFLPLVANIRYYAGRKVFVDLPLFPGYVFLRGSADDAYALDRAGRLAQIIEIVDQKRVNQELRNIGYALLKDAPLSQFPYLRKGVRVEVRTGPLRGLQGVIEDLNKRDRIILQVEILGRGVSLEVDGALLDVID